VAEQLITLGKVSAPFGVRGWTKVTSYTTPLERLLEYPVWRVVQRGKVTEYKVVEGRPHGKFIVVKFDGIDDRDDVALLTNASVVVDRQDLPTLDPGDFYWADLIGLSVSNTEGVSFGKVERLMETGSNDVLVVAGDRERLIPWIMDDVVMAVDINGSILVDWDADF